eukprot:TRINITY_DN95_c0_g2_i4.p1 TRINITY_DN95_c0_g2~~TRINITY_DN95_c0_g2_i4.p1  ORF type:complete len:168 (+),score=27.46 TRINITY_DN95_c0_g2_i4:37-504(+)
MGVMRHIICVALLLAVFTIGAKSASLQECLQLIKTYNNYWAEGLRRAYGRVPGPYDTSKATAALEAVKNANCAQHNGAVYGGCVITGCRQQICSDKPSSDCTRRRGVKEECLKLSICGPDGVMKTQFQRCGWVFTPEYLNCVYKRGLLLLSLIHI